MPNVLDITLARERWRSRFKEYWKKDTPYRQRKLAANRAYVTSSSKRIRSMYVRRRNRLGLIPLFDVLRMTGLSRTAVRSLSLRGIIPIPTRYRGWHCYSVEQVACLTQAVLSANIDKGYYSCFSQERFEEYIRNNWPDREAEYDKDRDKLSGGDGDNAGCVQDSIQPGN